MGRLIGAIWVLPVAIPIWVFYLVPLWATGRVVRVGAASPWVFRFLVVQDGGWYSRAWGRWSGFAMPFAIIMRSTADKKTERHELRHTDQWLLLGPLFPIAYGLLLLLYGYGSHPLELDAIEVARRG